MNTQPIAGLPSLPQPKQSKGSTMELIETNAAEQAEARQSLLELKTTWEQAARAGEDCAALEDQIEAIRRTIRRLELQAKQLADEKAAAQAAQLEADRAALADTLAKLTKDRRELALRAEQLAHGVNDHNATLAAFCDRADLDKVKRVALDAVRILMDELRRTLLAANAARPQQVNAARVFEVGTGMRAR